MTRLGRVVTVISLFTVPTLALMAQWAPLASDANAHKRIEWWREARIGLFMHWGVYAIPGRGEWVQWAEQMPTTEYAKLMTEFHPEHFRAEKWAQTACLQFLRKDNDERTRNSFAFFCIITLATAMPVVSRLRHSDKYGIANSLEVYPGTHTSKVGERFQNHVMPFFN